MLSLNLKDFSSNIKNIKGLNKDDLLVRELYQLCSSPEKIAFCDFSKFKSKHFLVIYKELQNENTEDMNILNDLVVAEYVKENLSSSSFIEDDEEIY